MSKPIQKLPERGMFAHVYKTINQIIDKLRELELKNGPEAKINRTKNGTTIQPTRRARPGDSSGADFGAKWQ